MSLPNLKSYRVMHHHKVLGDYLSEREADALIIKWSCLLINLRKVPMEV